MRKIYFLKIVYIFIMLAILSCSREGTMLGDSSSKYKSDIMGYVNLYDEGTLPVDKSGMIVNLVNGSLKFSSITDANGKYLFKDVPYGIYNLFFEKQRFGTFKKYGYQHFETGISSILNHTYSLGQESSTEVIDCSSRNEINKVIISLKTEPSGNISNTRYIRCFLSSDSYVNSSNYQIVSAKIAVRINPYEIVFTKEELLSLGFKHAEIVYLKVYGDSYWSNDYEDERKQRIFPNLNKKSSTTISFQVP